jgi:hypothetical protein
MSGPIRRIQGPYGTLDLPREGERVQVSEHKSADTGETGMGERAGRQLPFHASGGGLATEADTGALWESPNNRTIPKAPRILSRGWLTAEEYVEAIKALRDGSGQLEPDGRDCTVCGDSGHQAFECEHNPLVMARWAVSILVHQWPGYMGQPEVSAAPSYRCFHCGFIPQTEEDAREHYGADRLTLAACRARTDPDTIAAIVQAVREEDDDEQAETLVHHLMRGASCDSDDEEIHDE